MDDLRDLVERALAEDLGQDGDLTARATVAPAARARATITQKEPGVIYGLDAASMVFSVVDSGAVVEPLAREGNWRESGDVMRVEGLARGLLAGERTALNFLGRLSGVATLAARFAQAVDGTQARVLDTRKTTPGLRALEKRAVAAGGASNHRFGLHDAILIKENHIALAGGVRRAVELAREAAPGLSVEVECRDRPEIEAALAAGAPRILLDNMSIDDVRAAVALVDGRAELECSGGVTLESVRALALTGVQFISVGAMTHSAPALDLSLILEPL